MSGNNEVANKQRTIDTVKVADKGLKQSTSRLGKEKGFVQTENRATLSTVRSSKTFIKPNSKAPINEQTEPVPWPMPPRSRAQDHEAELRIAVFPKRDGEKECLAPQSSFDQHHGDNTAQIDGLFASESYLDGFGTCSREGSAKQDSFSSVGTGISLAFANSSESGSSDSVRKVDIDADEFARLLSEKARSSHSAVDFTQLFAEGDKEILDNNNVSSPPKRTSSQEFSENSTTPKAIRAPFRRLKNRKAERNTVSLTEALEFSPDHKVLGTKTGPPVYGGANKSGSTSSHGLTAGETGGIENEPDAASSLRRPLASKRKTFVILPQLKSQSSIQEDSLKKTSDESTGVPVEKKSLKGNEEGQFDNSVVETTPPVKGVIMRAQSHVSHVAGIRRAETGRIMSRAELRMQNATVFQESPNPKSLNPAGFPNEEEDVVTTHLSCALPASSSESGENIREQATNSVTSTSEPSSFKRNQGNKNSSGTHLARKVDDGSFLSPGILSRKKKYGTEEYRIDSFQYSEHDGSSGPLNRFSSGFRKVHWGMGKKSSSNEVAQAAESAIVVPGTIHEAVCKICVVCRNQLDYDVFVKDTGKKIKVESRKDGKSRHLRATILVRQMSGESLKCEVYIRQSRSDGMKTSLATLWNFHQRLEAGLKEMG